MGGEGRRVEKRRDRRDRVTGRQGRSKEWSSEEG
jgi:hypothetical protein